MGATEQVLQSLQLDPSSPVPLHHQASRELQAAIADGRLVPGTKLPGEAWLAEQLNVSKPTMRSALGRLVDEGLLVRRRGVGTIVTRAPIRRPVALSSLFDDLQADGREPRTTVIDFAETACPQESLEPLHLETGTRVVEFTRLRFAGSDPIALMHNVVPADLVALSADELGESGFYAVLRRAGIRPQIATQRIGAAAATKDEAAHLRLRSGAPLVAMERTTYDHDGRPIEHARHRYPAGAYSFEVTLVEGR